MTQSFDSFMGQLKETNATLDYFTDFEKVNNYVRKISIKLNQLNYLLGKDDIQQAISDLFGDNPKTFEVLDILIAVRKKDKKKVINDNNEVIALDSYFNSAESIYEYVKETGLEDVFKNKQITNLVDYVFGIEVGLDTNARKNRGGHVMEKHVAKLFSQNNITFETEKKIPELENLGTDIKRFDFVIKTNRTTYLIETNFYNAGGSKLNEVARAYTDIAPKINANPNYEFVWITDGPGWNSAKNKLQEACINIPHVYNLTTIENFMEQINNE